MILGNSILNDGGEILAIDGLRANKLGYFDLDIFSRLISCARDCLNQIKPDLVITGAELGWNLAFARAAFLEDYRYVLATPVSGQQTNWPLSYKDYYNYVYQRAAEVHTISRGKNTARKRQVKNEWMVKHATHLAVLWDGSDGTTGRCVDFATKMGKPVINYWDNFEGTGID